MFYNFHAFSGYFFSDTKCYAKVSLRKCATHAHKLLMAKVGKSLLWHNRIYGSPGSKFPTICRQDLFLFKAHFWTCIWKDLLRQLYDLMRLNFNWDSEINHSAQKMLKKRSHFRLIYTLESFHFLKNFVTFFFKIFQNTTFSEWFSPTVNSPKVSNWIPFKEKSVIHQVLPISFPRSISWCI